MNRSSRSTPSACGLLLILVACQPAPDHQLEPPGEATAPTLFHEYERPQNFPRFHSVAITPGECPADNDAEPSVYFDGAVRVPLPAGVDVLTFLEVAPGFARLTGAVESSNCREGWPGAIITFMALIEFEEVPDKPHEQLRAELFEVLGYPSGTTLVEGGEQSPNFELWAYEAPPTDHHPEPSKMLLALTVTGGRVFVLVYECHPDAWPVLVNTFVDSATRAFRPAV